MEWSPNYAKSTGRGDGQCCWCAPHRTERVADHHGVCAGVARLHPRDVVAGIGSGAFRLAVEEPLVIQGCHAGCYHAEGGGGTSSNRLALRLAGDNGGSEAGATKIKIAQKVRVAAKVERQVVVAGVAYTAIEAAGIPANAIHIDVLDMFNKCTVLQSVAGEMPTSHLRCCMHSTIIIIDDLRLFRF